jgi:hypothetical protein
MIAGKSLIVIDSSLFAPLLTLLRRQAVSQTELIMVGADQPPRRSPRSVGSLRSICLSAGSMRLLLLFRSDRRTRSAGPAAITASPSDPEPRRRWKFATGSTTPG